MTKQKLGSVMWQKVFKIQDANMIANDANIWMNDFNKIKVAKLNKSY